MRESCRRCRPEKHDGDIELLNCAETVLTVSYSWREIATLVVSGCSCSPCEARVLEAERDVVLGGQAGAQGLSMWGVARNKTLLAGAGGSKCPEWRPKCQNVQWCDKAYPRAGMV